LRQRGKKRGKNEGTLPTCEAGPRSKEPKTFFRPYLDERRYGRCQRSNGKVENVGPPRRESRAEHVWEKPIKYQESYAPASVVYRKTKLSGNRRRRSPKVEKGDLGRTGKALPVVKKLAGDQIDFSRSE